MTKHIIKVQRPLHTTEPNPQVLVYNQDRSILQQFPFTEELQELFRDDVLKLYFEATLRRGELTLVKNIEQQDW
jgi:hypothetical protein